MFNADDADTRFLPVGRGKPEKAEPVEVAARKKAALDSILMVDFA